MHGQGKHKVLAAGEIVEDTEKIKNTESLSLYYNKTILNCDRREKLQTCSKYL